MSADSRMMNVRMADRIFQQMRERTDSLWMMDLTCEEQRESEHGWITDCQIVRAIARRQMQRGGYLPPSRDT